MAIVFNNTYSGGQVSTGLNTTVGNLGYTGTSLVATGTSYEISGTVSAAGSAVTVTRTTAGAAAVTSTATYEGYITVAGATYYVFGDPALLGTNGAFAISATGSTVSLNALQTITPALPSPVCFLAGSLILTRSGEVAVERLKIGDMVAVLRDGVIGFESVRWIGHGAARSSAGAYAIDDLPVRIRQNAIGDNIPNRDLLVTPEHCLHLDGVLVPARMLVNAGSIATEPMMVEYSYYHVELDRHGILIANGLATESYLDTGNRANFRNNDVTSMRAGFASPDAASWPDHAAAPLAVDRAVVEPIWNRLAGRARLLGYATGATTADPVHDGATGLRIVTQSGSEIMPTLSDGRVYAFVIPAGSGVLRLRSRSGRPSDLVGPFLDDRRMLGVQVGRMGIVSDGRRRSIDAHLSATRLSGWHAPEAEGTRRWTDGDALLPLDAATNAGDAMFLDIEVVGVGPYRAVTRAA